MIEARILGYLAGLLLLVGGGGYAGWTARDWKAAADERQAQRHEKQLREARDVGIAAAAQAIAQIEVKNVTVRQRTEKEFVDRPVYRDCVADERVLALTNEAITGEVVPAADGGLPAAGGDVR